MNEPKTTNESKKQNGLKLNMIKLFKFIGDNIDRIKKLRKNNLQKYIGYIPIK